MAERVEQRGVERARVWVPLRVAWNGGEAMAVTHDASDRGALMLMRTALPVGTRVTVTFEVPGDSPRSLVGTGRVVRSGPNADDPHGLWRNRVAIALDEAMEAFGAELSRLSRSHPLVGGGR